MSVSTSRTRVSWRRLVALGLLGASLGLGACGNASDSAGAMPPLREMDEVAFGISMLRLDSEDKRGALANEKLLREAYEELRQGKPFGEVARAYSDDPSKGDGGFMGFVNARGGETAFAGAVQATAPGRFSLPFATKLGPTIVYRHSFEEAMELETRNAVPILGFPLPYGPQMHRDARGAAAAANEAVEKIKSGELTLGQARQRYAGDDNRRPGDEFLGAFRKHTSSQVFWETIRKLKPGELAPAFGDDRAWYVVQRAEPLMALVRHIFIGTAKFSESIKAKENEGYSFEDADGSIALMALDTAAKKRRFFQVESYHVHIHRFPKDVPHNGDKTHTLCDATLLLNVNGVPVMAHSDVHNGPVNALDAAMRKCLEGQFPAINKIQLTDYKVRVIDGKRGRMAAEVLAWETAVAKAAKDRDAD